MKKLPLLLAFIGLAILVIAFFYFKNNKNEPTSSVEPPSLLEVVVVEPPKVISYKEITLISDTPTKELTDLVGTENIDLVLRLNRIDERHVPKGAAVVVPNDFDISISDFPNNLPIAKDIPKLFLISQKVQSFGAYEYGQLVRSGPVSSGKLTTPTPSRLYSANWKGKEVISSSDDEWILKWNINLDNFDGIGIHQYDLPGFPASHSCVRLLEEDAMWLYEWVEQWILDEAGNERLAHGTPFVIFDRYDFTNPAPWKKLIEDPKATQVSEEELNKVLEEYLETILIRHENRMKIELPNSVEEI